MRARANCCSRFAAGLVISAAFAGAQHLVLTIRTHPTCPVEASGLMQSKDFAFQVATFRNESPKFVETINVKVAFAVGSQEEIVDSVRVPVRLTPGESRKVELQLGRVEPLEKKLRASGQKFARAIMFVDSAQFSDGTEWTSEPVMGVPSDAPVRPPK